MLQNTLIMKKYKKYKIGILGAGSIARAMAWTAGQMENTVAYAVASRSMDKARAFAENHNVERAYGSYEEMLDDPEWIWCMSPRLIPTTMSMHACA